MNTDQSRDTSRDRSNKQSDIRQLRMINKGTIAYAVRHWANNQLLIVF
jgi:hypothetical protein